MAGLLGPIPPVGMSWSQATSAYDPRRRPPMFPMLPTPAAMAPPMGAGFVPPMAGGAGPMAPMSPANIPGAMGRMPAAPMGPRGPSFADGENAATAALIAQRMGIYGNPAQPSMRSLARTGDLAPPPRKPVRGLLDAGPQRDPATGDPRRASKDAALAAGAGPTVPTASGGGLSPEAWDTIGGIGQGLLAVSGWSDRPRTIGEGLGIGMQIAEQRGERRADREDRREIIGMRRAEFEREGTMYERKMAAEDEAKAREKALLATLTPEQRTAYLLGGGGAVASRLLGPEPLSAYQEAQLGLARDDNARGWQALELQRQEIERKAREDGQPDPAESFKDEMSLRKEYEGVTKTPRMIMQSLRRLERAATEDTPTGDIATVYAFMKMQDADSAVREGEYATAENSSGVSDWVRNLYNKALSGVRLTPQQRAMFLNTGRSIAGTMRGEYESYNQRYTNIARNAGLDPDRVVIGLPWPEPAPVAPVVPPPPTMAPPMGGPAQGGGSRYPRIQ